MKRFLPIIASLLVVFVATTIVYRLKHKEPTPQPVVTIGSFEKQPTCSRQPHFLTQLRMPQPIAIDLSQERYRGLAFLYGANLSQSLHPKVWEQFDHFSTYALDPQGNMYLTPMPYISVKPATFNLQKNIYKLDSNSGQLAIWVTIDEVKAGSNNPFGVIALDYDCEDQTLWISAIDETDYTTNRGVIYHIDTQTKTILQRLEGVDALSLRLIHTQKGKYLLVGSARDHHLYAYTITNGKLNATTIPLLEMNDANEHIRKITVRGKNHLLLETIPFSYTLIAQTAEQGIRTNYDAYWDETQYSWHLAQQKR